jgi:hypothetical protein
MNPFSALRDGIRRVNRAPAVLFSVWTLTMLVSLPLAVAMNGVLKPHPGSSPAAETASSGVNSDVVRDFADQSAGPAVTFTHAILGFAREMDSLSAFVENRTRPAAVAGAASTYALLWMLITGGIIDRYARDRPTRVLGFSAASGVFFVRFLRLAVVQCLVYAVLFGVVHPWLFGSAYAQLTRNITVERTAFLVRASCYGLFGLVVTVCMMIFDYAKVRAVVEDRRSMLGALVAAARFIQHNAGGASLLFVENFTVFAIVAAIYALVAPGAGRSSAMMWTGFTLSQFFILARLWVKLTFWASETALFQGRLAHAGYVARAVPVWPESPGAEAI